MAPATTDEALKNENHATLRRKNALNLERLPTVIWLDVCTSCNGASVKRIEQAVLRPGRESTQTQGSTDAPGAFERTDMDVPTV